MRPAPVRAPDQGTPIPKNAAQGKKAGRNHTIAIRIQALTLAEVGFDAHKVWQITGVAPWTLSYIKKTARARGYDPAVSMQRKEEYVEEGKRPGRPKKNPDNRPLGAVPSAPTQWGQEPPLAIQHQMALAALATSAQSSEGNQQITHDATRETSQWAPMRPAAAEGSPPHQDNTSDASSEGADAQLVEELEQQLREESSEPDLRNHHEVQGTHLDEDAPEDVASVNVPPTGANDIRKTRPSNGVGPVTPTSNDNPVYQLEALLNPADDRPSTNERSSDTAFVRTSLQPGSSNTPEVARVKRKYSKKPKPPQPRPQASFQQIDTTTSTPFGGRELRLPPSNWNFDMTVPLT